jgi:hypothetical protein
MTALERRYRELVMGERIRSLAVELLAIEDASPVGDRIRFRQAVIHLTRASDRLHAAAAVETDLERLLRLSIARIQAQRGRRLPEDEDGGGLVMEGGMTE